MGTNVGRLSHRAPEASQTDKVTRHSVPPDCCLGDGVFTKLGEQRIRIAQEVEPRGDELPVEHSNLGVRVGRGGWGGGSYQNHEAIHAAFIASRPALLGGPTLGAVRRAPSTHIHPP